MAQGKLNPQIVTVEVGIKSLREVTIYPLSLADQAKTARILATVFQKVMQKLASYGDEDDLEEDSNKDDIISVAKQLSDVAILEFVISAIQENLETILKLVVDEGEVISIDELTNEQFYELAEIIYVVNYENALKNFPALWKRARGESPMEATKQKMRRKVSHSKKPSPRSVDGTTTG